MSYENLKAELEQLRKENAALRKEFASGMRFKVSGKGGVSVYEQRRSPVTLYKDQWLKLLDRSSDIRAFIAANKAQLKGKDRWLSSLRPQPFRQSNKAMPRTSVFGAVKILTTNEIVYTSLAYCEPD
jgi:hypothetical protein